MSSLHSFAFHRLPVVSAVFLSLWFVSMCVSRLFGESWPFPHPPTLFSSLLWFYFQMVLSLETAMTVLAYSASRDLLSIRPPCLCVDTVFLFPDGSHLVYREMEWRHVENLGLSLHVTTAQHPCKYDVENRLTSKEKQLTQLSWYQRRSECRPCSSNAER